MLQEYHTVSRKKTGEFFDFEQIATWVIQKAELGLVPLDLYCDPYLGPCTVPLGITIGIQRDTAEIGLHSSRDLLKINYFHPDLFLDTVWCS